MIRIEPLSDTVDWVATGLRLEELVARQSLATPDRIALIHDDGRWSYRDIETEAESLARDLIERGVGRGTLVALCVGRSVRMVTAILAVLKAGGAFVPLDPAYPPERLNYCLRDCGATLLLVDATLPDGLDADAAIVDLRDERASKASADPLPSPGTARDVAYVIYTSGSTGQPKGVVLAHSAVAYLQWARSLFRDGELARVAATTSICFDPAIFEIFAPLATGGTIVLKESILSPFADDERPTLLQGVPSVLAELARTGTLPTSLRVVHLGGETLTAPLVDQLHERGIERIYNHYGPTEATTCTTVALARPGMTEAPPLGEPICDAVVHLLDDARRPVPVGEIGEIAIGGPQLAVGYLDRPDLTARSFVPDPFGGAGGRLYMTGDLARRDADGNLHFVGRIGDQIKLHGVRIELGEVEAALATLPGLTRAVAAVRPDERDRPRLVAYHDGDVDPIEARRALRQLLPDVAVPSIWMRLETFPLTLNGKIDRAALPEPPAVASGHDAPLDAQLPTEDVIRAAFADMLGLDEVGIDDDFFDLGGDSMMTIELALELETRLDEAISPHLLKQAATPRAIASAIGQRPLPGTRQLFRLSRSGEGTPLFAVPDLHGRPASFVRLAAQPGFGHPVFGLGIADEERARAGRIDLSSIAAGFANDIRAARPAGPYIVAGFSFGGMYALELARILDEGGEDVTLVLLDAAFNGDVRRPAAIETAMLARLRTASADRPSASASNLLHRIGARAIAAPLWRTFVAKARMSPILRFRRRKDLPHILPDWIPAADRPFARSLVRAAIDHRPQPFLGRTVVVKCLAETLDREVRDLDGRLGWRRLLRGDVRAIGIECSHTDLMLADNVAILAERLDAALCASA